MLLGSFYLSSIYVLTQYLNGRIMHIELSIIIIHKEKKYERTA